jgi:2-oxoglutarate dehydrogenase E2 component (dihydrolipoamide succinyltransferase)
MIEIKVPVLAESISEASLLDWEKQVGDVVQAGDKLVDIETDKIILEITTPESGVVKEIIKAAGSDVSSEEVLARIDNEADTRNATTEEAADASTPSSEEAPKTSPSVRKLAAEQGVDIDSVPHSGDRVTKEDVIAAAAAKNPRTDDFPPVADAAQEGASDTAAQAEPVAPGERPEQRVPMTRLRRRVAERLLAAQQEHAILTTFNEVNMQAIFDVRNRYKTDFEKKHDARLGFMSFFVKASVAALKEFPVINASTDGDDVVYHGYYDIGIAVSSPRGLVVPILRDADTLSFAEVEKTINDFGKRAKDNKLTIDDLDGGTFSITNGGVFGSMLSTPILNPPQSAILGMHNIVERPVAENGQVVIRPIMYVALSYDHRLVDGREAVSFLFRIKQSLEDPARLLLEM